ncbi:multicopper oxidase domain-containing protein [Geopsychrobacter electrodiphilus]|uniref:multicopper oxidase domain-containing protein n=1 Tax=Geopsychrobacter electrodiphilus TaxID=225196 RepID=UPI000367DBA1|nr:multicopper oxidase [Geopsychrobacter electrodiphilus]
MFYRNRQPGFQGLMAIVFVLCGIATTVLSAPLPGGTLDPLTIPKYVTPLVIPPEMPKSADVNVPVADYNIAVRQFQQQILPGLLPPTTVWSYGRAEDVIPLGFVAPVPLTSNISFNYPAFTIETQSKPDTTTPTKIRWINDLVYPAGHPNAGNYLPHLLTNTVDQTLHWANPAQDVCRAGTPIKRTDCATNNPLPYTGPVPIVTHVHGSHVNQESDGYPEAWWLPGAPGTKGIPATYAEHGTLYTQYLDTANPVNNVPGSAFYAYENDQPATTLWYHDHSLGMTRLNVYAGPAGFYLIRGGAYDGAVDGTTMPTNVSAVLPGPAPAGLGDPNFDAAYRASIREVPIVIQDRSFNLDGSLFYPGTRAFFDGYTGPTVPNSDIAPIWNPEAFFNTMVVNGTTWPTYTVAPERYRFRLLNGSNSRFLNLSMFEVIKPGGKTQGKKKVKADKTGVEVPFYQIGADQGSLPQVVMISTGFATPLPGDGTMPLVLTAVPAAQQALLMTPAERADVIVDFSAFVPGTIIRMYNTAPDAPFGGFPDVPADPSTTGQVMEFVVGPAPLDPATGLARIDPSTPVQNLRLNAEPSSLNLGTTAKNGSRQVSLNEAGSHQVCVAISPQGTITVLASFPTADPNIVTTCAALGGVEMGPKEALLGTVGVTGGVASGIPLSWMSPITENPQLGAEETWEIYNFTVDGHPIHLHLVRFQVEGRQLLDPLTMQPVGTMTPATPSEAGWKDTVLAYPGEVTRIRATFDKEGLYVWHCHIVEHEDNEMMRPYYVGPLANSPVP